MFEYLRTIWSLVAPTIVSSNASAVKESTSTIDNLQAAFNGESNANARYRAFARKADEERFGEVASLFRAAAKAEEIHARNHSDVIRKLGATPTLNLESIEVKTTRENLKVAIAGETYERDIMYPEFIEVAKRQRSSAAVRSFTYALKVEAVHAVLFQDALDNLRERTGKNHTYYVCPDCGNTLEELSILTCVVCGHAKSGFIAVS
jgi:rubrerythrin